MLQNMTARHHTTKRIIVFLAGTLIVGAAAALFSWPAAEGLVIPRADLTASHGASGSGPDNPVDLRHATAPRPTPVVTAEPTPGQTPSPTTAPTPLPSTPEPTMAPEPTPLPTPRCGGCGGGPGRYHLGIMCPMYCVEQ